MTKGETHKVRLAAKSLLHRLLSEPPLVLIQNWFKDSQTKERLKSTVQEVLNIHLLESYDRGLFTKNATQC
jgi:type I restriction enzyme R subunit